MIVVAHREYQTLEACLRGFREAVQHKKDLIFVDNGSGGRLSAWCGATFPDITIVPLAQNRLFCGGYNAGLRIAMDSDYEYALLVNADTELIEPLFIGRLIDAMERWPGAAFIGPKVFLRERGAAQNTIFDFPSVLYAIWAWLPYRIAPGLIRNDLTVERSVSALNGVCVLCRISALREVGLMDETYGAYMEDLDWAWRARRLGWHSVFVPTESIIHHEEPTGYEHYSMKTFLLKRNTVKYYMDTDQRISAFSYAAAASLVGYLRILLSPKLERARYRAFLKRLMGVFAQLLRGTALDEWYGPPLDTPSYGADLVESVNIHSPQREVRAAGAKDSSHDSGR